ncbi:MAG: S8 family serine peptidase [Candidatus Omnitrophica bacterium]|nr:S8 family serine peptidase [Candidatus Omnitrophota bacterium]
MKKYILTQKGKIFNRLLLGLGLVVSGLFLTVVIKVMFLNKQPISSPFPEKTEYPPVEKKEAESFIPLADKEEGKKLFVQQKNFFSPSPPVVLRSSSEEEPEFIRRLQAEGMVIEKLDKISELKPEILAKGREKLTVSQTREYFKFPYVSGELMVMSSKGGYLLKVEKGAEEKAAELLSYDKEVLYAVPNTLYPVRLTAFPENPDPGLNYQWHLLKIEATQTWEISRGEGVKVAVLDTGIDLGHPDLKDNLDLETSYDYVDDDQLPEDTFGHGTIVAGAIAGVGDNDLGIYGVAPQAKLMVLKIIDNSGTQTDALKLSRALMQALGKGAGVINISFGSETDLMAANPVVEDVFNTIFALGIPLVASAGNHLQDYLYPAAYEPVIAVGGTNKDDGRWKSEFIDPVTQEPYASAVGEHLDLAAPAEEIFTTARRNPGQEEAYAFANGTSLAAALVSGVCALLLSYDPHLSLEKINEILQDNTDPINTQDLLGWGRVNAFRAIEAVKGGEENLPPVAKISAHPLEGNAPLEVQFSADGSYDPDGRIIDYVWSFGDGEFINQNPSPKHTYQYGGKYDVVLMVKDNQGAVERKRIEVKVEGEADSNANNNVFNVILSGGGGSSGVGGEDPPGGSGTGSGPAFLPPGWSALGSGGAIFYQGPLNPQGTQQGIITISGTNTNSPYVTVTNPTTGEISVVSAGGSGSAVFSLGAIINGQFVLSPSQLPGISGVNGTVVTLPGGVVAVVNGQGQVVQILGYVNPQGELVSPPPPPPPENPPSENPPSENPPLHTSCFIAGTLIRTDKGLKPIELIEIGDKVLSYNETTQKTEYKPVIDTLSRVRKDMIEVKVEGGDKFICSREHRFYVKGHGWLEIDKVKEGEILLTAEGRERKLLKSRLINPEKKMRVFNLTVGDNQNYYVGKQGVLVHNTKNQNNIINEPPPPNGPPQ